MALKAKRAWLAAAGGAFALGACGILPQPAPPPPPGPRIPVAVQTVASAPYLQGDVIGGRAARTKKAVAGGTRRVAAAEAVNFMNMTEIEIRRQTAGTGVDVIRSGEMIVLRMPASLTFDVGKADVRPQAEATVREVGLTLKRFNTSLVDVLGHSDSTGTAAANVALSDRRAQAVATRLRSAGVAAGRLATKGFGSAHPIADNATEEGRASNRRVEIKIVPLR